MFLHRVRSPPQVLVLLLAAVELQSQAGPVCEEQSEVLFLLTGRLLHTHTLRGQVNTETVCSAHQSLLPVTGLFSEHRAANRAVTRLDNEAGSFHRFEGKC